MFLSKIISGYDYINASIREHIINNFKEDSIDELKDAVNESVDSHDELTLPGLGVLMSLLWDNSNDKEKDKILDKIKLALNKG